MVSGQEQAALLVGCMRPPAQPLAVLVHRQAVPSVALAAASARRSRRATHLDVVVLRATRGYLLIVKLQLQLEEAQRSAPPRREGRSVRRQPAPLVGCVRPPARPLAVLAVASVPPHPQAAPLARHLVQHRPVVSVASEQARSQALAGLEGSALSQLQSPRHRPVALEALRQQQQAQPV